MCGGDFSVAHGGENDINRHKNTSKHKRYVDTVPTTTKLADFDASSATANLDQKVVNVDLLFSGFLAENNLPLITADHTAKLFWKIFPDSIIVNKYRCGLTNTTQMLTEAVAKQITSDLKEELLLTGCYRSTTDGRSDEVDKFLPVLVRYVGKD